MPPELRAALPPGDPFEAVMGLEGETVRGLDRRRTMRVELGGRGYFVKLHYGVGWRVLLRKLLRLRVTVMGAEREWRAIHRVQELGIPTTPPVAFGQSGEWLPVHRRSFLITADLGRTLTLEELCEAWPERPPPPALRRALIDRVADVTRTLHENGLNHRDLYLCHFRLDLNDGEEVGLDPQRLRLHLMDLHRMRTQRRISRRARVKDVAALYFSAMDCGLGRRDLLRFMRRYAGTSLRQTLGRDRRFWLQVRRKAEWVYRKQHGREPPTL